MRLELNTASKQGVFLNLIKEENSYILEEKNVGGLELDKNVLK